MSKTDLISIEKSEKSIYFIRGEKVMLDRDLAHLYQVATKTLTGRSRGIYSDFRWILCFSLLKKRSKS